MRRAVWCGQVIALVAFAALAGVARADELTALGAQPLFETAHTVAISIKDGVANYHVHRVIENRGTADDEVELVIELPTGAAASGLRVRAHGGAWIDGAWTDAKSAARNFYGGSDHASASNPSALLRWLGSNFLDLQVFPVPAGSSCEVDYELTAPTTYEHGQVIVSYPRRGDTSATVTVDPLVTVKPSWRGGTVMIAGGLVPPGAATLLTKLRDANATTMATFSISAANSPNSDILTTRLGRVVASDKHGFARLEVDIAPQLSSLPKQASVVFVLDASHSMTETGMAAELAIVRSYLRHVPDASFEIVAFRRHAERIFGRFVAATDADAAIAEQVGKRRFALGNGSSLDDGARVAVEALIGHRSAPRIVFVTDERMRKAFATKAVVATLAKVAADTVVHVVTPDLAGGDASQLYRDDDSDALAPLAVLHHGIAATWSGLARHDEADMAATALAFVRPTQLDNVRISGLDVSLVNSAEVLHEGDSIRATRALAKAPTQVTLDALLWSQHIHRVVTADGEFSRAFAGWVFSEDEAAELSAKEKTTVAAIARTVTPVTSFVVTRAGWRAEPLTTSGMGSGDGNYASVDAIDTSKPGRIDERPSLAALLDNGVHACVTANHPAAGWTRAITVEITRDEVVDVTAADTDALSQCLVEAAWAVRLTAAYTREHDEYALTLR